MPALSSLLPPGYRAYAARREQNEQAEARELQSQMSLVQLAEAMQARRTQQQEREQERAMMAGTGGNLEAVVQAALKAGRADIAAKLAPLIEAQRKANLPQPEVKPPPVRQRYDGTNVIQEELQADGTWKQIGTGPRFQPERPEKPQTFPVIQTPQGVFERRPEGLVRLNVPGTNEPLTLAPKGADAGMTPENAGKVAMSRQAIEGVTTTRGIIFDQNGKLNRGLVGAMNLPLTAGLPGNSQARIARSAMRNAVEAKLRIETGAAATESEVERTLARFMPSVADTNESAKFKMDELEKFFKSSLSLTKGAAERGGAPAAAGPPDPLGIR